MTLSRYVKIRTFPYGSWLTVITTCDWTSCIDWFYFHLCLIQLVLYNWKYLQFSSVGVRSWMESSRYRQQTHGLLIYLYMWWFIIFFYAWWRLVSLLPTLLPKGMHSNGDLMLLCLTLIVTLNQLFHLLTSITLQVKLSQKALKILSSLSVHQYSKTGETIH